MAKMPPKKQGANTGDWLNTYADMVTLLLTFFVLLFACSNLDETKLQFIFQEFRSRGRYFNRVVQQEMDPYAQDVNGGTTDTPDNKGGEGEMPESFDQLYMYLSEFVNENNLAESIALDQGAAHITIRFDDGVFFDPDSAILRDDGRAVLRGIIPAVKAVNPSIRKVTITGHTSRGTSDIDDYELSSMRAVNVTKFLRWNGMVDEEKYRVSGFGPNEPISEDDPVKNRRVEMMILKNDLDFSDPEVIKDIMEHDYGIHSDEYDPYDQTLEDVDNLPEGSIDKIVGYIDSKFPSGSVTAAGASGPQYMDISQFAVQTEESGEESGGTEDEAAAENETGVESE